MKKGTYTFGNRLMALLLCIVMVAGLVPVVSVAAEAPQRTADPSTLHQWKNYFGELTSNPNNVVLSTEYAGGVWTDKSVFTADSIPTELTRAEYNGESFSITDKGDNFLVSLSAIASNKEITGYSTVPTDTVFVLDMSSSMRYNDDNGGSAIDELVDATNDAIADLLALNKNNRIAVVLYAGNVNQSFSSANGTTQVILPLDTYTPAQNGTYLQATSANGNANWGLRITDGVANSSGSEVEGSKSTSTGTFMQDGIYEAMRVLLGADTTVQTGVQAGTDRLPIMVLMTDGEPTLANSDYNGNDNGDDLGNSVMHNYDGSTGSYTHRDTIAFMTMLTAAYAKKQVAAHYGDALFYTLAYGEEVTRLDEALSVMDPAQSSSTLNTLWNSFLAGSEVQVYRSGSGSRRDPYTYLTVKNGTTADNQSELVAADKLYVDEYFPAETDEDFSKAFASIVNEIIIQSKYYPTYVENDHDHDGYLTFVDKIGSYMEVTDIKGIVVGDRLFSGAALASNFDAGNLGTIENPKPLGDNLVWSVQERLGIADTAVARALLENAYNYKQLSYTSDEDFSHYIGWFSDANGNYVDFWYEGISESEYPDAATHIIKSYGFLGDTTVVGGVSNTDMMYMSVRVTKEIATGESLITWQVPASLIPTITYEVSVNVDSDGKITDVTALSLESGTADTPIRLLYEVSLREDIYDWNLAEKVPETYKDSTDNKETGYVFYTNKWKELELNSSNPTAEELEEATLKAAENTTLNTYSHFEPSVDNERYYYTEDSLVYADDQGTVYTGVKPTTGTFYRQYIVYEKLENGNVRPHPHYEPITAESLALAKSYGTNQWVIPKGTVHRYYDFETTPKDPNSTATMGYSDHPFIVKTNEHYYTYSTQGNNGKLTMTPATGIKLTKALTEAVEGAANTFTFTIAGDIEDALLIRLDDAGNEKSRTELPSNGQFTVDADETVYIIGLSAGSYTITEGAHADYSISSVVVDDVNAAGKQAIVTVTAQNINDVKFTNRPIGYGNLMITKEITPAQDGHTIPNSILSQEFNLTINVGTALAGKEYNLINGTTSQKVTIPADGKLTAVVKHGQTLELEGLPEDTVVTIHENLTAEQELIYQASVKTRDHSGAMQDDDNQVTVYGNSNATAIIHNVYDPADTSVNMNVKVTKDFQANGWTGSADFTFKLQQWIIPTGETKHRWVDMDSGTLNFTGTDKKDITLPDVLYGITYTEAGTYAYQVVEVIPDGANKVPGVTYDRTLHTFTVTVTDNGGQLVAAITDASGAAINGTYAVNFTNTYHTAPISIDIVKDVKDTTENAETSKAGFEFVIYEEKYNDSDSTWYTTGVTDTIYSDAAGEARFSKIFTKVDGGSYPMKYRYLVLERNGNLPGWSYDSDTRYYVSYLLDVDGSGNLVATLVSNDYETELTEAPVLTFTNKYDPVDATVDLDTSVFKTLNGRALEANEFTFAVFKNGEASHTDTTGALLIGTNAANGSVNFSGTNAAVAAGTATEDGNLIFSKIGTYEYDVVEIDSNLDHYIYSDRIYDLVVEVSDAGNGALVASWYYEDATTTSVTFTNTYIINNITSQTISGSKTLTGRPLLNAEFTFRLTEVADADGTAIQDALVLNAHNDPDNNRDGTSAFAFEPITYTTPGTHYYKIEEIAGVTGLGVTYAGNHYIVKVTVNDDGAGSLTSSQELVYSSIAGNSTVAFTNVYKPQKATTSLHSTKELTGKVLSSGDFDFTITQTEDDFTTAVTNGLQETVANNSTGGINFSLIEFTAEDTRYYVIEEVYGGQTINGITYDASKYLVTVTATDNHLGNLVISTDIQKQTQELDENDQPVTVTVAASSVVFNNTYTANATAADLEGTKVVKDKLTGAETKPAADAYTFELYHALLVDEKYVKVGDRIAYDTNDADGKFTFDDIPLDTKGTHTFMVVENKENPIYDIIYDKTEYVVLIEVLDDGKGNLYVNQNGVTVIGGTANSGIAFTNTYDPTANKKDNSLTVNLFKEIENSYATVIGKDGYQFKLEGTDNDTDLTSDATGTDGRTSFTLNYTEQDIGKTYNYTISEILGNKTDIVYSTVEHALKVTVGVDGANLTLSAVLDGAPIVDLDALNVTYTNIYDPKKTDKEINVTVDVSKVIQNKYAAEVGKDGYKFQLTGKDNGTTLTSNATDKDGKTSFSLRYTEQDIGETYTYMVSEVNTGVADIRYDAAVYTFKVSVSVDAAGKLAATVTVADKEATPAFTFTNSYDPKLSDKQAQVPVDVTKVLNNTSDKEMALSGFEFKITDKATGNNATAKSNEAGKASFLLTYTEDHIGSTYTYELVEVAGNVEGMTYDTTVHTLTVKVDVNAKGELVAKLTSDGKDVDNLAAAFTNTYAPVEKPVVTPPMGDEAQLMLWFSLLAISAVAIMALVILGKKKRA